LKIYRISYLRFGYWPSYNIPFFERIYNESGFTTAIKVFGDWLTYDMSPRSQIFRRDANQVTTAVEFQRMLRYNDWQKDPLSDGNPGNQISSRFDLVSKDANITNPYLVRAPFGGVDSKMTSYSFLSQASVMAQSGPTHDSLPPFNWNDGGWKVVHEGMPDVWNFGWVEMSSNF